MTTITHTSQQPRRVSTRSGSRHRHAYRTPHYRHATGTLRGSEVVLVLLVLLAMIGCALASRPHAPRGGATATVRVQSGETLWSIAKSHPVSGMSTAQTADYIAQLNNIDSSSLRAGAIIKVPSALGAASAMASLDSARATSQ